MAHRSSGFIFVLFCALICLPPMDTGAFELPMPLKKMILEHNSQNAFNHAPNGGAGPLSLSPEVASKAGLKVYTDDHLKMARSYRQDALRYKNLALTYLDSLTKGETSPYSMAEIIENVLLYKRYMSYANDEYNLYTQNLNRFKHLDERFDVNLLMPAIDMIFFESLRTTHILRDALGSFYSKKSGYDEESVSSLNVNFVNKFFRVIKNEYLSFVKENGIILERADAPYDIARTNEIIRGFVSDRRIADAVLKASSSLNPKVDPLIFFTLIRRESNLDQYAVSPMAAVGLTQIIPSTARHLGMKGVYEPDYLGQSLSLLKQANATRDRAYEMLFSITSKEDTEKVRLAIDLLRESAELRKRHSQLLRRYRSELIENGRDERIQIESSVYHGMKYFYKQLEDFDYDLSLALSAYNAGPGRVREYKGIPPFSETIKYRNWIVSNYYKVKPVP